MEREEAQNKSTTNGLLIIVFALGEASFGIDAQMVQEVVKVGEITPVHGAPSEVKGIRNLRGHIVTVVDTAVHLKLGSVQFSPETRLLIMERDGESYGFLVDRVTDALSLDENEIAPPPSSIDAALRDRLKGVWRDRDRLIAILDPEELFKWKD